jgi:hypothetical protein
MKLPIPAQPIIRYISTAKNIRTQVIAQNYGEISNDDACVRLYRETFACTESDPLLQAGCKFNNAIQVGKCGQAGGSCWPHWNDQNTQGYECSSERTCRNVGNYLRLTEGHNVWDSCSQDKKLYYSLGR